MNIVESYSQIIRNILTKHLYVPYIYDGIDYLLIIDRNCQDYLVIIQGLPKRINNASRVYDCVVHLEINNDRIIIYRDKIEYSIKDSLIDLGISQDKIELFFDEKEAHTKYVLNFKHIYDRHQKFFTSESTFERVAINPDVTSTELDKLAAIEHKNIGRAIAKHLNASPDLLIKLFTNFPVEVLSNPIINLLLLEQPGFLEKLYNTYTNIFAQNNINLPNFFIEWAVDHELEEIRSNVAQYHILPDYCSDKLAKDESCLVVQELYKNPILNLDTKNRLNIRRLLLEKECPYKLNHPLNKYDGDYCICRR